MRTGPGGAPLRRPESLRIDPEGNHLGLDPESPRHHAGEEPAGGGGGVRGAEEAPHLAASYPAAQAGRFSCDVVAPGVQDHRVQTAHSRREDSVGDPMDGDEPALRPGDGGHRPPEFPERSDALERRATAAG